MPKLIRAKLYTTHGAPKLILAKISTNKVGYMTVLIANQEVLDVKVELNFLN